MDVVIHDVVDDVAEVDDGVFVTNAAPPVARDWSICWEDDDYYNIGGAACVHQCTGNNTLHCVDDCCGTSLGAFTKDCTYNNMKVRGSMPKCLNDCLGNAVTDSGRSDCDTNGAAIDLPKCVSDCKTADKAPLCKDDCHFYAANASAIVTSTMSAPTYVATAVVTDSHDLACRDEDYYNLGGLNCDCSGPNTAKCTNDCCTGASLALCFEDCIYTNKTVKGPMPKCVNDCTGNAVMDMCVEDCEPWVLILTCPSASKAARLLDMLPYV